MTRSSAAPRILAYSDSSLFSGAEGFLCDAVGQLSARGADVVCAAPRSNAVLCRELESVSGAAPIDVPAQGLRLAALDLFSPLRRRAVARAVAGARADVMLVNLPSVEYGSTPLLAPTGSRPPALGMLHIAGSPAELGFRLGGLRARLGRRAMRDLEAVGVVTESGRLTFDRLWQSGSTRAEVVRLPPPGVKRVDRARARADLGLGPGPVVGMVGRITVKQKGHDVLVQAAPRVLERCPDVTFAVAGEGKDRDKVQAMTAQLGVAERFQFLGQVNPVETFLSAIDAVAIPSRFEGLPYVALEAIEVGTPGVAARTDGLRDVWPEEWQVDADDPRALADGLATVLGLEEEEVAVAMTAARARAEANTADDLGAQLEVLLAEIAGG